MKEENQLHYPNPKMTLPLKLLGLTSPWPLVPSCNSVLGCSSRSGSTSSNQTSHSVPACLTLVSAAPVVSPPASFTLFLDFFFSPIVTALGWFICWLVIICPCLFFLTKAGLLGLAISSAFGRFFCIFFQLEETSVLTFSFDNSFSLGRSEAEATLAFLSFTIFDLLFFFLPFLNIFSSPFGLQ